MRLIYEQSIPGRRGVKLPASDVPPAASLPQCPPRQAAFLLSGGVPAVLNRQ